MVEGQMNLWLKDGDLNVLLEPTFPLLQKFKNLCPGTFKHCQSVASICEFVSSILDLDSFLMRIAATYHDIGKMFNPTMFCENQLTNENPHSSIDPYSSYQIITRHVSDGVTILLNENFPRQLMEIISQHHGNTVVKYFHNKAPDEPVDKFRYKFTTPKSIEAAILMICDHLEARSRSLLQNSKFDSNIVNTTIDEILEDGQLDDVTMKFGDLKKIKSVLSKELEGFYQKRPDYDVTKK